MLYWDDSSIDDSNDEDKPKVTEYVVAAIIHTDF
jgi:hypothetical protein